jgi:hypothetical protein
MFVTPWAARSLARTILGSLGVITTTAAACYPFYDPSTRTFSTNRGQAYLFPTSK